MRLEAKIASLESMLGSASTGGAVQSTSTARPTSSTPYAGRPPHVLSTNSDGSGSAVAGPLSPTGGGSGSSFHPYFHPTHEKPPSRRQVLEQQTFSTALEELFSSEPTGSHAGGAATPGWYFTSPPNDGEHPNQPFSFPPVGDLAYGQSGQMPPPPHSMAPAGVHPAQPATLPLGFDGLDGGLDAFRGLADLPTPPMQSLPSEFGPDWHDPAYSSYAQFAHYLTPQTSHLMPPPPPPPPAGIATPLQQQQQAFDPSPRRSNGSPTDSATPPQGLGSLFDATVPVQSLPKNFLSTFQSSAALPGLAAQSPGGRLEVPRDIRDSLLSLFWMRRRQFGCVLHPRFFSRLDLAPAQGAPHPSLVFAMLTCAAKFSANATVRSLEPTLFYECRRLIDKGLEEEDEHGMLNIIQASIILTIFFFSQGRYPEGWTQSGVRPAHYSLLPRANADRTRLPHYAQISMRLAIGAQLHRMRAPFLPNPSNAANYKTRRPQERGGGSRRRVGSMMPPPTDMIDVGERIWAFWLAVIADKSISTANCWPSALADHEIETPFPRPIGEYTEVRHLLRPCPLLCPPADPVLSRRHLTARMTRRSPTSFDLRRPTRLSVGLSR